MSWNWGSRASTGVPSAPEAPTPVSSAPPSPTPTPLPTPQSFTSSGVGVDLTSPSPISVYQPQEGAGFGNDPIGSLVGLGTGVLGLGFKTLSDATQGVDKVIGTGLSMWLGNRAQTSQINVLQQFHDAPDTPEKQAALARIQKEAPNDQYKQSEIAFEYLNHINAYLFPQMQMPTDSTATGLGWNILNQFFAPAQLAERTVAGAAGSLNIVPFLGAIPSPTAIGPGGNRLNNILGLIEAGKPVTDTEKWAADQYRSGNWTAEQALDFLAGHGAGYSGDFVTNLMGELVLDPSIGVPVVGELGKLAEAGKAGRVGAELATKFAAEGGRNINVLRGLEIMANAGDRTANTVLKVGGLIRDTVDPLGAIWGRAPTRVLIPGEGVLNEGATAAVGTRGGLATAVGFSRASGRSTDILENFSGQLSARMHGAVDPGLQGRHFYEGVQQVGLHYGKPGAAIGRAQLDVATGMSNIARRVLIRTWVAQHVNPGLEGAVTGLLDSFAPDDVIRQLIKRPPENFADLIDLELGRVAKKNLTYDELRLLADRMTRAYGMDAQHWMAEMPKWSEGSRALAHLATYGNETGDLVAAVQRIMSTVPKEVLDKLPFKVRDLYLMNADTLTRDEAARIIKQLGDIEAKDLTAEEAAALQESATAVAKEAAGKFGKMPKLSLDGTPAENLNELVKLKHYLEDAIAQNVLPSQINPREVEALRAIDGGLAELHDLGTQGKVPWKLGVAPPEDVPGGRWGLVRDGNGQWHSFHDTWATHVAANATGYLPLAMRVGLRNGEWGVLGNKVADGVDIMENVINTMSRSISSAMVTQNATDRMVRLLTSVSGKKVRGGGLTSYGFTKDEAQELANALTRTVNETNIPARGMFEGERWDALEQFIPNRLRATREFTPTDLTSVVMRAYQGDFRVVGATQYFTGALKVKSPKLAIFAERVVPFVRFSASPVFQSQMRVEGTFWNILRGNWAAFGPVPTKFDQEVYLMLERAAGTSVRRSGAEMDAAVEMSQQAMHGTELAQIASDKWGVSWWDKISNAKGAEQLNYLRAIQGDIYSSLEKAARETGFDLNSVIEHLREVHPQATPDQLATHYYYEMLTGRPAIPDVINPGEHVLGTGMEASIYGPANMGKLGVVDGNGFLERAPMFSSNGRKISSVIELRRELGAERMKMSEVRQHLEDLNVPKASADRFINYVNFDWNAFWGSVRRQFGLTPEESFQIQNAIAAMAERHGVTPSDFLSQILSPVVGSNKAGTATAGTAAEITDAGQYVLGLRGVLRSSTDHASTSEDLLNQLADVFIPHLNPSAQEVLAEALQTTPEGLARRVAQEVEDRLAAEEARAAAEANIPPPPAPAALVAAAPVTPMPVSLLADSWWYLGYGDRGMLGSPMLLDPLEQEFIKRGGTHEEFVQLIKDAADGNVPGVRPHLGSTAAKNSKGKLVIPDADGNPIMSVQVDVNVAAPLPPVTERPLYHGTLTGGAGPRTGITDHLGYWATSDYTIAAGYAKPRGEAGQVLHLEPPKNLLDAANNDSWAQVVAGARVDGKDVSTLEAAAPENRVDALMELYDARQNKYGADSLNAMLRRETNFDAIVAYDSSRERQVVYLERPKAIGVVTGPVAPAPIAPEAAAPLPKLYHGSAQPVTEFVPGGGGPPSGQLFGPGVYATDNPRVAVTYQQKGAGAAQAADRGAAFRGEQGGNYAPNLNEVQWKGATPPRIINGDTTLLTDAGLGHLPDMVRNFFVDIGYVRDASRFRWGKGGVPTTLNELFRAIDKKVATMGEYIERSEVDAIYSEISAEVGKNFDAIQHAGGVLTDSERHTAYVFLDPSMVGAVPLPPDAERVMHEFGSWTHEAIRNGLLKGKQLSPQMTDVLDRIGLLPRQYAVPYSFTEAQFKFAALDHLAQKEQDAMGLMYWRRQRSWAERTINHPMFGLYPASYMWGKVAPNFIKFLAKNQFGLRTAAGLSAVRDAQLALAARYEFDPAFQKQVESLGASNALWFVSYLLPGAPWDVGAAAPAWANEALRQADDNAQRVHRGLPPKPLDVARILDSETRFLSIQRGVNDAFSAASEVERSAEQFFKDTFGGSAPSPTAQPVHATDLPNILEPQVQQLQQTLLR